MLQLRQRWSGNEALWAALKKDTSKLGQARLNYFWINKGPWSVLDGHASFMPPGYAGIAIPAHKPEAGNFYPQGATKQGFSRQRFPAVRFCLHCAGFFRKSCYFFLVETFFRLTLQYRCSPLMTVSSMLKLLPLLSLVLFSVPAMAASSLNPLETRWLQAAAPVVNYAREQGLPLDIVVQPQDVPGSVPLALGFAGGRCKLVLSMRGNAQAETVLQGVPSSRQGLMIATMAAHEIGHCRRHAQGDWHALPRGFVERGAIDGDVREQGQTRREEGYADLVALAWVHARHIEDYQDVLAWLGSLRQAGGSHDTRAWLALAGDSAVFDTAQTPFEQAELLWRQGLEGR